MIFPQTGVKHVDEECLYFDDKICFYDGMILNFR